MIKIISILGISFLCLKAIAQNNFEGKITYSMSFANEKENTVIDALFGNQKIKVLVKESGGNRGNKEDLILDFKNGVFYKITNHNKSYTIDSFKKSNGDIYNSPKSLLPLPGRDTVLLGFRSLAYTLPVVEKVGDLFENMKAIFWYADSLRYSIPEAYASFEMVPLFTNGTSVGLGMTMSLLSPQNIDNGFRFTLLAIEAKNIPDKMLEMPPGYTIAIAPLVDDMDERADTSVVLIDTIAIADTPANQQIKAPTKPVNVKRPPVKNPVKNKSKAPAKKPDN